MTSFQNRTKSPNSFIFIGSVVVFAWMFLFNIRPIEDPDIWWHLASGRWMTTHHLVPKVDVFSLTAQGTPWIDSYWLQEIGLYLLVHITGLSGLIVVKSLFVACFVFFAGGICLDEKISWSIRGAGIVWIFLACQPRGFGWEEKASYVTLAFMALLFWRLRLKKGIFSGQFYRTWPILFLIWANMHRGFILGLVFLGVHIIEKWVRIEKDRYEATGWGILCAAVTLINPWGYRIYKMGWQDYHLSPALIAGWDQTPFFHLEMFWFTLVIFWMFVAWSFWTHRPLGIGFLVSSLILTRLSTRYASFYPYFVIWAVPWILSEGKNLLSRFGHTKIVLAILGVVVLSSFSLKPAFGINARAFPLDAVEFLQDHHFRFPFFHDYEWGGFYLWELEGSPPDLIDGRYPAVQGYQRLYPRIQEAMHGTPENFHLFLENLHIHCALVKFPKATMSPSPLAPYFPRKDWALIYWDDVALFFVERKPEFQTFIKTYEFQRIEPYTDPSYWLQSRNATPLEKDMLLQEAVRNVKEHPTCQRAQNWIAVLHHP